MSTTRRLVTGHTPDGRSVVVAEGPVPHTRSLPGAKFHEVWSVDSAPAVLGLSPAGEPTSESPRIARGSGTGNLIRVIEFAPASEGGRRSPMHRTRTLDYGIVLEGEIVLILSDSEVLLRAGDVVIQRATDHAWENRSGRPAKMVFVLVDAEFDAELSQLIEGEELIP
ncbi:MAG TPA: cupin domain-containing protein [Croceibacterium sp.]|jgi:quercetin dioxygenase-like cupin family protein